MKKNSLLILITILLILSVLTSCYEDYLVISTDFKSGKINRDSTQVYFFHTLQTGQPPKGISRFPDGGTQKIIYKNVSLYSFDVENQLLNKIFDFGNLPYTSWSEHISLQKNKLLFNIKPTGGWEWRLKHSSNTLFEELFKKYKGFYSYDLNTMALNYFDYNIYCPELSPDENQIIYLIKDSSNVVLWHLSVNENSVRKLKTIKSGDQHIPITWKDNNNIFLKVDKVINILNIDSGNNEIINSEVEFTPKKISINIIKKLTSEISFKEWGFSLTDYYQKSNKEYIHDIVVLNGNLNYRRAILQNISNELSTKDYKDILIKMDKYQDSLEGLEKTEYEIYSKETKELINQYIN
jgi:hypothetical protein